MMAFYHINVLAFCLYGSGNSDLFTFSHSRLLIHILPLITNPKVFPSLCNVTSTVLKMTPDPCTAEKLKKSFFLSNYTHSFGLVLS